MKEKNTYHSSQERPNLPDSCCINPFLVPDDYFEQSASTISSACALDHNIKEEKPHLNRGFDVPPKYFDSLSSNIRSLIMMTSIAPADTGTLPFETPTGYFETLSTDIETRIRTDQLTAHVSESGWTTPPAYFEDASSVILAAIVLEKGNFRHDNGGYQVDSHYFDSLTTKIVDQTSSVTTTAAVAKSRDGTVRSLRPIHRFWKYGIAASVVCLLSISLYVGFTSDNTNTTSIASSAAVAPDAIDITFDDVSDQELVDYLALNNSSDDIQYYVNYIYDDSSEADEVECTKLADQDLEEYIKYML